MNDENMRVKSRSKRCKVTSMQKRARRKMEGRDWKHPQIGVRINGHEDKDGDNEEDGLSHAKM